MTTPDLPPVHSSGDAFLAVIAQRQAATNELLAQILHRLPDRPAPTGETVELREPAQPDAPPAEGADGPDPVEVAEPADTRPAPRQGRKRTTPKKGS